MSKNLFLSTARTARTVMKYCAEKHTKECTLTPKECNEKLLLSEKKKNVLASNNIFYGCKHECLRPRLQNKNHIKVENENVI